MLDRQRKLDMARRGRGKVGTSNRDRRCAHRVQCKLTDGEGGSDGNNGCEQDDRAHHGRIIGGLWEVRQEGQKERVRWKGKTSPLRTVLALTRESRFATRVTKRFYKKATTAGFARISRACLRAGESVTVRPYRLFRAQYSGPLAKNGALRQNSENCRVPRGESPLVHPAPDAVCPIASK
jgi:hypothetical protein